MKEISGNTQEKIFDCPAYRKCGGCQMDLDYRSQLEHKSRRVETLLGGFCRIEPMIGMEDPLHYRHKVSAAFCRVRGRVISGVWQSSSGRIAQTDGCMLEHRQAEKIVRTIRQLAESFKLSVYDERTGYGLLRFVTLRFGYATGQILVALGTGTPIFPSKRNFTAALIKACPEITTIVQNVSTDRLNLVLGKNEQPLYGPGYITDRLCGLDFRISARSFFQINPSQAETLYKTAVDFAGLTGGETVIDAYCGVGAIGMAAAGSAGRVISVESNGEAVKNALENVRQNGLKNVRVYRGDAGAFMSEMADSGEPAQVVFTDPPRAGCSEEFIRSLIALSPEKIVYISCNPETQARDLRLLARGGYRTEKIQPVDMFPCTEHIETVALTTKSGRPQNKK